MPIIPTLGKVRQEDHEFKVSLGYRVRPCSPLPPLKEGKSEQKKKKTGF
jgi:hypothetical protein